MALDLIASADMPSIAWDAWESGLDGPATTRLGGLERPTYFEVSEVLAQVMHELGLSHIPRGEAALRIASRMATQLLESGDDPLQHLRDFESLWVRAGYPSEICALGTLFDDVWIAQASGRTESDIRESVISTLKSFVHPPKEG